MKKINVVRIISIFILLFVLNINIYLVKAVGAPDSNPNTSLGNGSNSPPAGAGQQQQQQDKAEEEREKKKKRKEFAKKHKNDSNDVKKKYKFNEIVDYVYGNYGIEGGSRDGFLNKVDEDEEVKEAWRKTLKEKAEKNDGSEAGIILESIGKPTIIGEGEYIFKQPSVSDSSSSTTDSIDGLLTDSETFLGKGENNKIKDESMQDFSKTMYNILITIATFVAVLVGGILGVKIMISSADEKAQVKELLIPYVIGCVVVFGAFGIWKLVVTILQNM